MMMPADMLRLAHLRGVLGSITNMGGSAASHARAALAYDGDPLPPDDLAATIRGLMAVIEVAMPKDLQAQDKRVRAGWLLLADLEGRDRRAVHAELDALLPNVLKAPH